ncbi:ABC transporter permease [Aeromicrobium phragmitis]|uniref:ABC transporter permease n=1 Tax=Aeromicrobium phragmitis TaxID=2478914 RepID=A0A3L8PQI7_9ACTN|nr:ABC transporter permease [Aeromicrobium phragmitis]RLV57600.1 ABC transporter permease [Aeromicrobium phragmitis]
MSKVLGEERGAQTDAPDAVKPATAKPGLRTVRHAAHIGRGVVGAAGTVLAVSVVTFGLMQLASGDAADAIAGESASAADVERVRDQLGLDRSVFVQFGDWAAGALQGDLGTSWTTGRPVTALLLEAAPATFSITALALILAGVVGVALGSLAGMRRDTLTDRAISVVSSLSIATPNYWVGLVLVSVFALSWSIFPATGYAPLSSGLGTWLSFLALPAIALGLDTMAETTRQTRGGVVDVMRQPYVVAARARGASGGNLFRRHVARNAAIPVVTVFGLQAARLLGGVVVIETVFAIPGLGMLAVEAVLRRDLPVIQGYVVLCAVLIVLINLCVDACYRWIDPKTRAS